MAQQRTTVKAKRPRAGRPDIYQPEFAEQVTKLCQLGATDMEIADFFGVTWRTVYRWRNKYPEFTKGMTTGKDLADERVIRALYQRAVGYEHDAVKIFMPANRKKPVVVPFVEHVAPDTAAATLWLKNRRPDEWRDKITHAVGGDPDGVPVEHGASALEELFGRIARIAAASGTANSDEPNDGSAGN